MLPKKLRFFLLFLSTILLIFIFTRLPKLEIYEDINSYFVLMAANKTYQCEVKEVKTCSFTCYELQTATLLKLKPQSCANIKGLKKGEIITFEVLPLPYSQKGEIPVKILVKP
jgi:hypothetical protein